MPISDIVFLDGNQPEDVLYCEDQTEIGKWFRAKNIDSIPLAMLGEIIRVGSYKELSRGFQPVVEPEGEAFLLSFPRVLRDKISILSDAEISNASSKWIDIEEFHGGMTKDMAENYISSLKSFFQTCDEDAYLMLSI